jgi:hypothetical protein
MHAEGAADEVRWARGASAPGQTRARRRLQRRVSRRDDDHVSRRTLLLFELARTVDCTHCCWPVQPPHSCWRQNKRSSSPPTQPFRLDERLFCRLCSFYATSVRCAADWTWVLGGTGELALCPRLVVATRQVRTHADRGGCCRLPEAADRRFRPAHQGHSCASGWRCAFLFRSTSASDKKAHRQPRAPDFYEDWSRYLSVLTRRAPRWPCCGSCTKPFSPLFHWVVSGGQRDIQPQGSLRRPVGPPSESRPAALLTLRRSAPQGYEKLGPANGHSA